MRPRPEQVPLHLKPPLIKSDVRLIGGFGDASPSVEFRAAVRQVTRGVTRGGFYEIEVVDLTTHLPAFVPEGGAFLNLERAIYRAEQFPGGSCPPIRRTRRPPRHNRNSRSDRWFGWCAPSGGSRPPG